jgi:HK97 family phage major capsid protein
MLDRIQEIKHRMEGLWDRISGLQATAATERRDPTDAELNERNGYLDDIDKLTKQLDAEERTLRTQNKLTEISRVTPPKPEPPKGNGNGHGSRSIADGEENAGWSSFGEMLIAVRNASMPGARVDPRLLRAATGLGETVPADGGFLVNKDMTNELLTRTMETGLLASRVRKIPVGPNSNGVKVNAVDETSRVTGSRWGGVQAYWINEADTKTASKPKFRQMELTLKKLIGLCYATDELLEDAVALEAVIRQAFAEEFGFMIDLAILDGTGTGQPLGILRSPALVTVTPSQPTAGGVQSEDIAAMWGRLHAPSRSTAVWLTNQATETSFYSMTMSIGTGGQAVFMPPGGMSAAPYSTLYGRPILPMEQLAAPNAAGDILLIDPMQYVMIQKGGIQSATSIHVRFVNDETAFRFVIRVDGQPVWNSALTPYSGTATVSPYVTLGARTPTLMAAATGPKSKA